MNRWVFAVLLYWGDYVAQVVRFYVETMRDA